MLANKEIHLFIEFKSTSKIPLFSGFGVKTISPNFRFIAHGENKIFEFSNPVIGIFLHFPGYEISIYFFENLQEKYFEISKPKSEEKFQLPDLKI